MAIAVILALMARSAVVHRSAPPHGPQPLGHFSSWYSNKDYPQEAAAKREEGSVGFALDIDASGLPFDCRITESSGYKDLDDRTCTVMMSRARFRPIARSKTRRAKAAVATTVAGDPMRSMVFRHIMIWKLPNRHQEQLVDRNFDAQSLIAPTGEVLSCHLTSGGASKLGSAGSNCGPFGDRNFLAYFLKADYKKVRSTNVRLSMAINGTPLPADRPPNFQRTLAKADLDIGPSGEMTTCTSVIQLQALARSIDVCEFVRADPPRFPKGADGRKATLALDLLAWFN